MTTRTTTWNVGAATHFYRRAGFGADLRRVRRAALEGPEWALADLFARRDHDPALMSGIRPLLALEDIRPVQAWWMALILGDRAPLVERVALMWHDHFATSHDKVGDARLMHRQVELFREHGLGDFRELLHAVARDPAMLVWLDGNANRSGQPNENFAREVMELFGLGLGNYSERDVQEAARAFTGWGVDGRTFVFREQYHDPGPKEIFGRRGTFGGRDAIDLVLAQPACARRVAWKLLEEFVMPRPSEALVREWAAVLVTNDWNIERTLRRLLASELFYSPEARRARIAGPVEILAITLITLGAHIAPADAAKAAADMGQSLFRPPSVKGWDGGRAWVHSGNWLARHNHLSALAFASGTDEAHVELAQSFGEPASAAAVVEAVLGLLLPDGAGADMRLTLSEAAAACDSVDEALRQITALVLTSPEYHLV